MLRNQPTALNQREQQQRHQEEEGATVRSSQMISTTTTNQREDYPPGHPNNPIGTKRAKHIAALERQMSETRAQMAKILEFQSKTLQECVSAATACASGCILRHLQNIRTDIVQTVS